MPVSKMSRGWTPPAIATRMTTGSAATSQLVDRTRPAVIIPATISCAVSRVASRESRLFRSAQLHEAIACEIQLQASDIISGVRLTATSQTSRQAKPRLSPRSSFGAQPNRSQNKIQTPTTMQSRSRLLRDQQYRRASYRSD